MGVPTVLGGEAIAGRICIDLRSPCALLVVSMACLVIRGSPPGVLFLVTCRCIRGLSFSLRFAVGLRDCIIAGASVIRGYPEANMLSFGSRDNSQTHILQAAWCSSQKGF